MNISPTYLIINISFIPILTAFIVSLLISSFFSVFGHLFNKELHNGIQNIHKIPTSRLGGFAIFIGVLTGLVTSYKIYPDDFIFGLLILIASLPIFIAGLFEDITNKVSANKRLFFAFFSALCIFYLFKFGIKRTDIEIIDWILIYPAVSLILTLFFVTGFTHSINVIDGVNGLASGTILIFLIGFMTISFIENDAIVFRLSALIIFSILGFLFWNYPYGKIFLGDGGAYFLGLLCAEIGLMLVNRSIDISPMAPVLIVIYPLTETMYTLYRRTFIKNKAFNMPDRLHLHTLLYRRVIKTSPLTTNTKNIISSNSKVSIFLWFYSFITTFIAVLFYKYTNILLCFIIIFIFLYVFLYKKIINFKCPKFISYLIEFVNTPFR